MARNGIDNQAESSDCLLASGWISQRWGVQEAWEAEVLPLNNTRLFLRSTKILQSDPVTSHGQVVEEW
jgi:hypothetical protein